MSDPQESIGYHEAWERFAYDEAIGALRTVVVGLNRRIDETRPWEHLRAGNTAALEALLREWLGELRRVSYWLSPFVPHAAERIQNALARPAVPSGTVFPRLT